ncbi:MAG TPA: hypothetical protein VD948_04815, partial [Rhodothermales bacterium]|nr:hypothetical protein [Rhodothermales bacterium]
RYGRHVATCTLRVPPSDTDLASLDAFLAEHFSTDGPAPERYNRREIDEVRVLAHWLYVHRRSARHVPYAPDDPLDAFSARVRGALLAEEDETVPEDEDDPEAVGA